jgi:hypothetical protein
MSLVFLISSLFIVIYCLRSCGLTSFICVFSVLSLFFPKFLAYSSEVFSTGSLLGFYLGSVLANELRQHRTTVYLKSQYWKRSWLTSELHVTAFRNLLDVVITLHVVADNEALPSVFMEVVVRHPPAALWNVCRIRHRNVPRVRGLRLSSHWREERFLLGCQAAVEFD